MVAITHQEVVKTLPASTSAGRRGVFGNGDHGEFLSAELIGNPDLELDVFPPYAGKDIAKNLRVFA